MMVVTSWANAQNDKMTISLEMVKVVILSVAQLVPTVLSSQLEINHVLNGTTPEIQHRKRGPKRDVGIKGLDT